MYTNVISSPWGLIVKVFKILFLLDRSEDRVSRGQYWIGSTMLIFISSFFSFVGVLSDKIIWGLALYVINMGLNLFLLPFLIKRLHDMNVSGWRVLPILIPFLSFYGFVAYTLIVWDIFIGDRESYSSFLTNFMNSRYGLYVLIFYGLCFLMAFLISLSVSFFKSVNEDNRFGSAPLEYINVGSASYRIIVIVFIILSISFDTLSKIKEEEYYLSDQEVKDIVKEVISDYNRTDSIVQTSGDIQEYITTDFFMK